MAWINLNKTTPAAPSNAVNVTFQKGSESGTQTDPAHVSAYVPPASSTAPGVIQLDGNVAHLLRGDGTWGNGLVSSCGITIDGGSSVPAIGSKGFLRVPFDCVIQRWTLFADQPGTVQITIKKCTDAAFPTTASIVSTHAPAMTGQQKASDTALTGWTTTLSTGDILEFNLDSVATLHRVTLQLQLQRS